MKDGETTETVEKIRTSGQLQTDADIERIKSETTKNTALANFWSSMSCLADEVSSLVSSARLMMEEKAKKNK